MKDAAANVRATTLKDYKCNLTLHLTPYFRGWKIRNIRRADVEALRAHLLDAGIGRTTVNKCLTLLGALFRYAIRHEYLEANPAEGTKLRGSSRRSHNLVEANILAPPEIRAFSGRLTAAGASLSSPRC